MDTPENQPPAQANQPPAATSQPSAPANQQSAPAGQPSAPANQPPIQENRKPMQDTPTGETSPPQDDPNKDIKKILYILTGILAVLLLIAGILAGYLHFTTDKNDDITNVDVDHTETDDDLDTDDDDEAVAPSPHPLETWGTFSFDGSGTNLDAYMATGDWVEYMPMEESPPFNFTLRYPNSWVLDDSNTYFYERGERVAGFNPPGVINPNANVDDACFQGRAEEYSGVMGSYEFVRKEAYSVDGVSGVLWVDLFLSSGPEDETYRWQYCIEDDKGFVVIEFYSKSLASGDELMYETIVSTFVVE